MVVLEDPYQLLDLHEGPADAHLCGDELECISKADIGCSDPKLVEMKVEIDPYLMHEAGTNDCTSAALTSDSVQAMPGKNQSLVLSALVKAFEDLSDGEGTSISDPYLECGTSHSEIASKPCPLNLKEESNTSLTQGLLARSLTSQAAPTTVVKPSRRAAPYPIAEASFNTYLDDLGPYGTSSSSTTTAAQHHSPSLQHVRPSKAAKNVAFYRPPPPPMPSQVISLDSDEENEPLPTEGKAASANAEDASMPSEKDLLNEAAAWLRGPARVDKSSREESRLPLQTPVNTGGSSAADELSLPRTSEVEKLGGLNSEAETPAVSIPEGVFKPSEEEEDLVGDDINAWIKRLESKVQDIGSSDSEFSYVEQSDGAGELSAAGDVEVPSPITPPRIATNSPPSDEDDQPGVDPTCIRSVFLIDDVLPSAKEIDTCGEPEPDWLRLAEAHDPSIAADAKVCVARLESEHDDDASAAQKAFEESCPLLVQYLIGHPQSLVSRTNPRKNGKGGKSKPRFFSDTASLDVMADKVLTGCWACGKLDHQSQDCVFKRCFICSQQGHEHYECEDRDLWCPNCGKLGHRSYACPEVVYRAALKGGMTQLRCVSCKQKGHIQCGKVPLVSGSRGHGSSQLRVVAPKLRVAQSPQQGYAQNGWHQRSEMQLDVNEWEEWDNGGAQDWDDFSSGAWSINGHGQGDMDAVDVQARCKQRGGRKSQRKR